jgi:D-alanine-D-alanine ligase
MKIVVLAGGISTERDVSFVSGKNVYEALKTKGHQVVLTDVYLGMEEMPDNVFEAEVDWTKQIGAVTEQCPDIEAVKAMRKDGGKSFFGPNVLALCQEADVVFVALHGENGENGKIQAAFDLMGIKYTCTDHVSSAICMDKAITKDIFRAYDIPTPVGVHFTKENAQLEPVALPCVVKACCGGSSIGVSVVFTKEEYTAALEDAFSYDAQVVVEQYIKGREFSVGVIAGKALPIIEIAPVTGFYDYKNKYQAGSAVETCPADLSEEITVKMQKCAEDVFEALRLKKYARMDFMLDENDEFYCLEANTVPGMTNTSLLPQEAAAVGISFEDLCQKLVEMALEE